MSDVLRFRDSLPADDALRHAIDAAITVVEQAMHVYRHGELVFSFNGGKDSTVVLHIIRAALAQRLAAEAAAAEAAAARVIVDGAPHSNGGSHGSTDVSAAVADAAAIGAAFASRAAPIYFDSPGSADFPEVLEFMAAATRVAGLGSVRTLAGFKAGMAELVREGVRGVIMGTRRTDPDGHGLEHFSPTSLSWPPCMRICPVLEWDYGQVWAFLRGVGVPFCVLYERGYTSLGGRADSWPNPRLLKAEGEGAVEGGNGAGAAASVGAVPAAAAAAGGRGERETSRFHPAWALVDSCDERLGRQRRPARSPDSAAAADSAAAVCVAVAADTAAAAAAPALSADKVGGGSEERRDGGVGAPLAGGR